MPCGSEALLSFAASLPAGMKEKAPDSSRPRALRAQKRQQSACSHPGHPIHLRQACEHASCLVGLE